MNILSREAQNIFNYLIDQLGNEDILKIDNSKGAFMPVVFEFIGKIEINGEPAKLYSLAHYYEMNGDQVPDPEMEIYKTENDHQNIGLGMIGELQTPMKPLEFLQLVKDKMECGGIRYSKFLPTQIKKVAVLGGSGSFAIKNALSAGADAFLTADLKYQDHKINKSVYVVGNEQDYHFDVLFKIMRKLGRSYGPGLYHLSYGMVDLPTGKMKSREGTVVDADELMEEMVATAAHHTKELGKIEGFTEAQAIELYEMLGMGALKYFLLKVDPKKRMLFNPQESIEFQGNTGPFIQYSHARIAAILRKAEQIGVNLSADSFATLSELAETESALIQLLNDFERKIKIAAEEYSPAILSQYLFDLAKEYNRFYAELPIFHEKDLQLQSFRVALSLQTAKTIKRGMSLIGIQVPERM
jgi:putative NIF3 family GTP cyclohydrolase 1 type 2